MKPEGKIDIRYDLINKELQDYKDRGATKIQKLNPTSSFISWLFTHYYTEEFTIFWYDDEVEIKQLNPDTYDRLTINNWIDPFGRGIWGQSQKDIDTYSRKMLKTIKNNSISYKDRTYIAYNKIDNEQDLIYIYYYGRDVFYCDYKWIMLRKDKKNGLK